MLPRTAWTLWQHSCPARTLLWAAGQWFHHKNSSGLWICTERELWSSQVSNTTSLLLPTSVWGTRRQPGSFSYSFSGLGREETHQVRLDPESWKPKSQDEAQHMDTASAQSQQQNLQQQLSILPQLERHWNSHLYMDFWELPLPDPCDLHPKVTQVKKEGWNRHHKPPEPQRFELTLDVNELLWLLELSFVQTIVVVDIALCFRDWDNHALLLFSENLLCWDCPLQMMFLQGENGRGDFSISVQSAYKDNQPFLPHCFPTG